MFRNSHFSDVKLGILTKQMKLRSARNDVDIEEEYLKNVRKICSQILKNRQSKNRLELSRFFEAVDRALNAKYFDFEKYEGVKFQEDLKIVRDQFGMQYPLAELIEDHKEFVRILSLENNRQRFVSYWSKRCRFETCSVLSNPFSARILVCIQIWNDLRFF